MSELEHYNVQIVTSANYQKSMTMILLMLRKTENENTSALEIRSDFVVMAVSARKNLPDLSACPLPLHYIATSEIVQAISIMPLNQHMMPHEI